MTRASSGGLEMSTFCKTTHTHTHTTEHSLCGENRWTPTVLLFPFLITVALWVHIFPPTPPPGAKAVGLQPPHFPKSKGPRAPPHVVSGRTQGFKGSGERCLGPAYSLLTGQAAPRKSPSHLLPQA